MKKTLLLLCAFVASIGAMAQNNVTDGKTVVPLGGLKTYTNNDEVTTYTISEAGLQKITVAGNADNVYLFPEGGYNNDDNKAIGIQGFYIDLGEAQSISNIQTTWEGAAASYKVYLTNTKPADDGTLTDATEIADYASNVQEGTKNIAVTSDATGQYIVCVPQVATNYDWGVKIRTFVALDKAVAVLGSLTVSPSFAAAGGTQTFTPTALSTTGVAISEGVTYTFDGVESTLEDVTVSAGEHTIVATYNGKTAEAKVYGITVPDAPEASTIQTALFANDGTTTDGTTIFINYDRGTSGVTPAELTVGSSKVKYATNAGKLFINNEALTSQINNTWTNKGDKNYTTLSFDLWSATAQSGSLVVVADGADKKTAITLDAATWKTVQVSLEDIETVGNISIQLDEVSAGVYPDFLVANVYMVNVSVEANPFNITAGGVVTGNVAVANVADINACTATEIDLTGATITEAIELNPANVNAIVLVKGTGRVADENGAKVTASNLVVYDGTYYRAAEGHVITITDNDECQPVYKKAIDAQADGFVITREIPAKTYVTTYLPAGFEAAEGIDIYEFTAAETGKVTFTKKDDRNIVANTPYVLYSEADATLTTGEQKADLNLLAAGASVEQDGVQFVGTLKPIAGDGTQYALQDGAVKLFKSGATIGAFRAYFTGLTASAPVIFVDGETTGIATIDANGEIRSAEVYNLAGQRVENPTKGLYIVNGKKVVLK